MEKITATGIESALVVDWAGWDGDHEWMVFYSCTLQPELLTRLTDEHAMPYGIIDVEIEINKLVGTIMVHRAEGDHKEIFRKSIKLVVSTGDFI
nr:MAG: hypothetical protein [Bacteriophage sp.]